MEHKKTPVDMYTPLPNLAAEMLPAKYLSEYWASLKATRSGPETLYAKLHKYWSYQDMDAAWRCYRHALEHYLTDRYFKNKQAAT